jgi:hypothetical protein
MRVPRRVRRGGCRWCGGIGNAKPSGCLLKKNTNLQRSSCLKLFKKDN